LIHEVTGLNGVLAISELEERFLNNHCSDPVSDCGIMLGSTPATQRYKVCPETTIPHGGIGFQEGGWLKHGRPGLGLDVNFPVY